MKRTQPLLILWSTVPAFSAKNLFRRTTQEARTDCLAKVSKSGAFQNANVFTNQEGAQRQVLFLLMNILPLFNILRGW